MQLQATQASASDARRQAYKSLDGILVLREGDKLVGDAVGQKHDMTFMTQLRAAVESVTMSTYQLSRSVFGGAIHRCSVARARLRIAASMAVLSWQATLRMAAEVAVYVLQNHLVSHLGSAPGTIVGLSAESEAALLLLFWKFDGTPHVAAQKLDCGQGEAQTSVEVHGTDLFAQRGMIGVSLGGQKCKLQPIIIPAVSIQSSSAANILRALRFKSILSAFLSSMEGRSMAEPVSGQVSLPPAVVVLSATTDQAADNVSLMRYLAFFMRSLQLTAVLVLISHQLCAAHQLSLCACTQYKNTGIGSIRGKPFISGLIAFGHSFRNASVLGRVWRATVLMVHQRLRVVHPASVSGCTQRVRPEQLTGHYRVLLEFLLRTSKHKSILSSKQSAAIDDFLGICNVATPLEVGDMFLHLCAGCNLCQDEMKMKVRFCSALSCLLFYHPKVPALTRWTSVAPCTAYSILWGLHRLAVEAFGSCYAKKIQQQSSSGSCSAAAGVGIVVGMATDVVLTDGADDGIGVSDYSRLFGNRLGRTLQFLNAPSNFLSALISVIAGSPIQRMLHWVLKNDSLTSEAKRHGEIDPSGEPALSGSGSSHMPILHRLVQGEAVAQALADAASMLFNNTHWPVAQATSL